MAVTRCGAAHYHIYVWVFNVCTIRSRRMPVLHIQNLAVQLACGVLLLCISGTSACMRQAISDTPPPPTTTTRCVVCVACAVGLI